MRIVVGLSMRDADGARKLVASQYTPGHPQFHKWLTPAQFTAMFNPSRRQAESVADYLKRQGFRNVKIEPNNLIVSARGSATQVEAAFHTTIHATSSNGRLIYGNTTAALVPSKFRGVVAAVLGLTNAFQMHVHLRKSDHHIVPMAAGTPPPCLFVSNSGVCQYGEYGPTQYQVAYDAVSCPSAAVRRQSNPQVATTPCSTGSKTSIAVMAEGDVSRVVTDLRTAETFWNLPKVPYATVKVGVSSPDTSGLDEFDLDTQISSGFAQKVKKLYVYATTSLSDSDVALEYSHWVTDDLAQVGSSSFGETESLAYADGAMTLDDEELNQGAAQGQTMFASTGDNGGGCSVIVATGVFDTGTPEVCYPAASPYVVAVGGTTLDTYAVGASPPCTDCGEPGTYYGDRVWIGTGGGISKWEVAPYWQANGICGALCVAGRGIADIAMCADNNGCPMDVFVDGSQEGVGGTSLSSPMSMGLWARLETHFNNTLGFAAPVYYGVYGYYEPCPLGSTACVPTGETPNANVPDNTALLGGFHDILIGTNGAGGAEGSAAPGWDSPTGLGSIDYAVMQAEITNSIFSGH
jgi:subtilase family serine protease